MGKSSELKHTRVKFSISRILTAINEYSTIRPMTNPPMSKSNKEHQPYKNSAGTNLIFVNLPAGANVAGPGGCTGSL
jgi:hypothetical protein